MGEDNINDSLVARFGLEVDLAKARDGFISYLKKVIDDELPPISNPDIYEKSSEFYKIQRQVLNETSRLLFYDPTKYENWDYGFKWFIRDIFATGTFFEKIFRLQVFIDICSKFNDFEVELEKFATVIDKHLIDFPVLGLTLRTFKTKGPQFFPTSSKIFTGTVSTTLTRLEKRKELNKPLEYYESGLKKFMTANTAGKLKNVIEDMYTTCDTLTEIVTKESGGFRKVFIGPTISVGLNKWQFEIFNTLRDWMDKIKHGKNEASRDDTEMIILLVSQYLLVLSSQKGRV